MARSANFLDISRDLLRMRDEIRQLRLDVIRTGRVPAIAWVQPGPLTTGLKFGKLWVTNDPRGNGEYRERKQLVGFEGTIDDGDIIVTWYADDVAIAGSEGHEVNSAASSNRLMLTDPFVLENSIDGGVWIRPAFDYISSGIADDVMLSLVPIFEMVPR